MLSLSVLLVDTTAVCYAALFHSLRPLQDSMPLLCITTGRPHQRYKDVRVRDVKAVDIDTMSWEGLAADRTKWMNALKQHLNTGEEKLMVAAADKRARRKEGSSSIRPETTRRCDVCNKDCHSYIVFQP